MMPMLQTPLFEEPTSLTYWRRVKKAHPRARWLADQHYSRQKVGTPQFMPPGQTIVLLSHDGMAVFGWHRPHPSSGLKAMHGYDGWTCTIFRNQSAVLSSLLILDAELIFAELGHDIGPDGLLTYVWDRKVTDSHRTNPGYCFKRAGWRRIGRSKDGDKTLLQKIPASPAPPVQEATEDRLHVRRHVGPSPVEVPNAL